MLVDVEVFSFTVTASEEVQVGGTAPAEFIVPIETAVTTPSKKAKRLDADMDPPLNDAESHHLRIPVLMSISIRLWQTMCRRVGLTFRPREAKLRDER